MNERVRQKFDSYPSDIRAKLMRIRKAVFDAAKKDGVGEVTETLKWGEISYLAQGGSTVRMGWQPKFPERVNVYFHCQTSLVDTFRILYREVFDFEGNRAIALPVSQELPLKELKQCISMSLRYHKIKHLPLLGAATATSRSATGIST